MAWIKRNLYFLIISLVALGLMGYGGFLLYSQISDLNQATEDIQKFYQQLSDYNKQKPHPGNDKVDNVQAAKDQRAQLVSYIEKEKPYFQRIAPIPDTGTNKVTNADFARQLRNTIVQMQRAGEQQSVTFPHDYYFSFEAQKKLMVFDPASLDKLAVQLGEVKAICDVLFAARVNSIDNIQREMVSTNDNNPPDYLSEKTVSTPLADLAPYRITFRGFSAEIASVLEGMAASPYGLSVKTINVEPASAVSDQMLNTSGGGAPGTYPPQQPTMPIDYPPHAPGHYPPGMIRPAPVAAPQVQRNSNFLGEKQLRITMFIEVNRLKPVK